MKIMSLPFASSEASWAYSGGKNKLNTILHKIGKSAVAQSKLWIEKCLIPHLKALNVSFNLKHQTLQKCMVTRLLGMTFESGTPREKGPKRTLIV